MLSYKYNQEKEEKALDTNMNKKLENYMIKWLAILIPIPALIGLPLVILLGTGQAIFYPDSFAVDQYDRLYVAVPEKICVYENCEQLYSIPVPTSKPISFVPLDDGNVLVETSTAQYVIDHQGNILSTQEDPKQYVYVKKSTLKFTSQKGDVYRLSHILGKTRIMKNRTEKVYEISNFSFTVKMLLPVVISIPFSGIVWLAVTKLRASYGKYPKSFYVEK